MTEIELSEETLSGYQKIAGALRMDLNALLCDAIAEELTAIRNQKQPDAEGPR